MLFLLFVIVKLFVEMVILFIFLVFIWVWGLFVNIVGIVMMGEVFVVVIVVGDFV